MYAFLLPIKVFTVRRQFVVGIVAFLILLAEISTPALSADKYEHARQAMVRIIERDVLETSLYLDKEVLDTRVMAAITKVPRHDYVPRKLWRNAYENRPLPIGYGQTISQPYIVAIMTDLLKLEPHHRVLEVGTGSGYQAAILAELVDAIYSIEIIKPLAEKASKRLNSNYQNTHIRFADGYYGWEEHAPFDAIMVTAAASHIPPPLIKQLKPGGRMMIPVGSRFLVQQLLLLEKDIDGTLTTHQILPVAFVPLTGKH
jgi:protein-L-isoaspartate(D-aspartate) O-methyltransferase